MAMIQTARPVTVVGNLQAVHRETAESTNARVMWWTLAEVAARLDWLFRTVYAEQHENDRQTIVISGHAKY